MNMIPMHITIKKLRVNKDLTQKEVAMYLGISQQAYSNYELNKRDIPARYIISLSELYRVSTDYILGTKSDSASLYDPDSKFIQNITLKDMISILDHLNYSNRYIAFKYLSYLDKTQRK